MQQSLPSFKYYRPATLQEATALLERLDGPSSLFAGGTDLLVGMKERKFTPRAVIDIKRIPELGVIQPQDGQLRLGGSVSTRAIALSPGVRERFPLLSRALHTLGSTQIGNRATIGGNLANASPAADSAPALLCLQASVKLVGSRGERSVPLESFFLAPGKTVIDREVLVEVEIPSAPPSGRGAFYKLGPRGAPEDICIVSVAVFAVPDPTRKSWEEVRIALGAVAPAPIRAKSAEQSLRGQPIDARAFKDAARLAGEKDAQPITDIRGSADYRRAMVQTLVERALEQVTGEIQGAAPR